MKSSIYDIILADLLYCSRQEYCSLTIAAAAVVAVVDAAAAAAVDSFWDLHVEEVVRQLSRIALKRDKYTRMI